ncbi:MAG: hypothetical protein V3U57_10125 [Robiginitomaculum sp.]
MDERDSLCVALDRQSQTVPACGAWVRRPYLYRGQTVPPQWARGINDIDPSFCHDNMLVLQLKIDFTQ